jgi:hypothetical protein
MNDNKNEKNSYRSLLEDERPRLADVFIANQNLLIRFSETYKF